MKNILYAVLLVNVVVFAQTKNVFLDREFWKSNPTVSVIEKKINEGNDPAELNSSAFDAVVYALLEKTNNTTVKHLLAKSGNGVNKLTHDGRTYIFWAAYKGNIEIMKYLLSKGAKTTIIDSHGNSILNFAATTGQTNPVLYDFIITKCNADPVKEKNSNGANSLLLLIPHLKNFKMIDYFVAKGLDIKSSDSNGNGAFNYAAGAGNKEMLEKLIKKGLRYKNLNYNGGNAMLMATRGSRSGYNSLSFFRYLESLGIETNITNNDGLTPLHNLSYRNKDIETLNYFLKKGVDINKVDIEGNTPLLNASSTNTLEVIQLFTSKTEHINHTNKDGNSALTKAIRNSPEVMSYLLKKGADVHVIDKKGNHLGYYLIKSYNPKKKEDFDLKLKSLTEKGLNFSKKQKDGNTPYHIALEKGDVALLTKLKNLKVDINAKNKNGETVLHQAAMTANNDKILKYLLKEGADKSMKTDFGEAVYDLAKENEILKEKKVDLNFLK